MAEGVAETNTEGAAPTAPSAPPGSGLDLIGLTKVFPGGTRRGRRRQPARRPRGIRRPARPVRLWQDDDAAHDRRSRVPDEGDIVLDGESLVDLPPHKRPTTTVFQHFALFPHRSVLDNVAFGLKMEGMGKAERRAKAMEALDMVGLTELRTASPRRCPAASNSASRSRACS